MAWIRLSDDYIDDEKLLALSDGAFRLWHEGLAYCRRKKTDGLIPFAVMREFRYFTRSREKQLSTAVRDEIAPLWRLVPGLGYNVNNYLDWNLSKEEEENEKAGSAARMRKFRSRVTPQHDRNERRNMPVTPTVTNAFVPDGIGIGNKKEEERAGKLLTSSAFEEDKSEATLRAAAEQFKARYPRIYAEERSGAHFHVRREHDLVFEELVQGWPVDRLEKMLRVFLHLPPGRDVLNAQGTPKQFLHHAPQCDRLLREAGR